LPISSILGGSATGAITTTTLNADTSVTVLSLPWLGGSYELDFSSQKQISGNEFNILNPTYPTSLNLNITQPLLGGLRSDAHRHLLQVSRKIVKISGELLQLQITNVVTQAIEAYWQLDFPQQPSMCRSRQPT
jgi:hypothetical protein